MSNNAEMKLFERATDLVRDRRYEEALNLLRQVIAQDPSHWNALYLAGQCYRYLGDYENAIKYLKRAADQKNDEAGIFLALGIALQLNKELESAISALKRAIEIDPLYSFAYNSLALTYEKRGELDQALHNYHAAILALSRQIVNEMKNAKTSQILKYRDTAGTVWCKYAIETAVELAKYVGIESILFPTGETAQKEERAEAHAGLYWEDRADKNMKIERYYLPNYFNTFMERLKRDNIYAQYVGNWGRLFEYLGRYEEARPLLDEAAEFLPRE